MGVPEPDGVMVRACERVSIRSKRNASDRLSMPCEQVNFFAGLRVVEPNVDTTRYSQMPTIWGIRDFKCPPLTQTSFRTFR